MSITEIRTDVPEPPKSRRARRRYQWEQVPIGGSFEFDDVTPEAVVGSFGHHLAAGKYTIQHQGGGRYRFWRLG